MQCRKSNVQCPSRRAEMQETTHVGRIGVRGASLKQRSRRVRTVSAHRRRSYPCQCRAVWAFAVDSQIVLELICFVVQIPPNVP